MIVDTVKAAYLALNNQTSPPLLSILSGELLSLGFGVRFRAPGTSMHPTIRHSDLITVVPTAPSKLKRGDIILYRFRGGFIAHRIVNVEGRNGCGLSFILRGDASPTCDHPVEPEQVLGKVVCLERDHRIIDPYSLRVRLWSMFYLLIARCRRVIFRFSSCEVDKGNNA
jgi:signal peptidase I